MGRTNGGQLPVVLGALTGGLLSSSCCVLQLVLNYTSIGCAGFSALTPYQAYFRLLTTGLLGYLISRQGLNSRTLFTLLLSGTLMFSQDGLSAYNQRMLPAPLQQLLARLRLYPGSSRAPAASRYTLAVSGIKCEACAAKVKGVMSRLHGVQNCSVDLAGGKVEVWATGEGVAGEQLVAAVVDKGYGAEVLQQECFDSSKQRQLCPRQEQEQQRKQQEAGEPDIHTTQTSSSSSTNDKEGEGSIHDEV